MKEQDSFKWKRFEEQFSNPDSEYRAKPFWAWNGELRKEELLRQIDIFQQMGMGGFFIHSRAGLVTEYLGKEWFELVNAIVDRSVETGMEAWLYDEDRWPSGTAGGEVTVNPEYRMQSLYLYEMLPESFHLSGDEYALFVGNVHGINLNCFRRVLPGEEPKDTIRQEKEKYPDLTGKWIIMRFCIVKDQCQSVYNGKTYLDTMNEAATNRFIELTHEKYLERCGKRMGTDIRGVFTDEPHRGRMLDNYDVDCDGLATCAICFTNDIFDVFQERFSYSAYEVLPLLFYRYKNEKVSKVKHDYIDLACNLFIERFLQPIQNWCRSKNMKLTGHMLHEDTLICQTVPLGSLMRCYAVMDEPGIDVLGEFNRCYWAVKQLTSVGRQFGKKHLLSELYGATGWQADFRTYKAIGDWQVLFGINIRCPHLAWYTMEGEAKRDYPASIFHQSAWFSEYGILENYFSRFSSVMSQGNPDCEILVLSPIETIWAQSYMGWSEWLQPVSSCAIQTEKHYEQLFMMLTQNQLDFDYGEEQLLKEFAHCKTENECPVLYVGKCSYHVVIVSDLLTMRRSTFELLKEFSSIGGKVIFTGVLPEYLDVEPDKNIIRLISACDCVPFEEESIIKAIHETVNPALKLEDKDGFSVSTVFAQVRNNFCGDGKAIVLLNTDTKEPKKEITLSVFCAEDHYTAVEEWNFTTGEKQLLFNPTYTDETIRLTVDFAPGETKCYVLKKNSNARAEFSQKMMGQISVKGEFPYQLSEPNVCVLDYARWFRNGEWHEENEVLKIDSEIRKTVGFQERSGEALQPWFIKNHEIQQAGKVILEYRFFVESIPTQPVFLVAERPEVHHYSVNGVRLQDKSQTDFWIDECFKRMKVPEGVLKQGENIVRSEVDFTQLTNIEALYLLGNFGVSLQNNRPEVTALPELLSVNDQPKNRLPFYSGAITYFIKPEYYVNKFCLQPGDRVWISLEDFSDCCWRVTVGDKTQVFGWEPYESDVTDAVLNHETILLTTVRTRRNTFGPLHKTPIPAPYCEPQSFKTKGEEWTDQYCLVKSGFDSIIFKIKRP